MTLKFNTLVEGVKVDAQAKHHQAKCSGSWVIAVLDKKENNNTAFASAGSEHSNVIDEYDVDTTNDIVRPRSISDAEPIVAANVV